MCLRGRCRGMPSSLIIVGLVLAWLVVLVPMIVRKRQEVARTADSALAARVVRSGDGVDSAARDESADSDGGIGDPEEVVMHEYEERELPAEPAPELAEQDEE